MRAILISVTGLMLLTGSAQAAVSILVDKDAQQMTVSVDGVPRYTWPVSSGNPSHETPNGTFQTFRMEADHYSKEFDDAPMPNAIFFTKKGHAIHGTDAVGRLGTPVSHGCVRLSRANALKLWDLVKTEGLLNTRVTLTGSSRIALARNPKPRTSVTTARATDGFGQPIQITPQGGYTEDLNATTRARQTSPDRMYRDQDQAYYPPMEPGPMQRRIYESQGDYYRGYAQQDYDQGAHYQRPRYPNQRGYYYYAD